MENPFCNINIEWAPNNNIESHKLNETIIFNTKEFEDFDFTYFSKKSSLEFLDDAEDSTEISSILINLNTTESEEKNEAEKSFEDTKDEILNILKKQPSTTKNNFKRISNFKSFSTKAVTKQIPMTGRILQKDSKSNLNNVVRALSTAFNN